ncbi:hypothetical protein M153_100070730 [Pseudoloma neurophilia]|uniref:Uncharacterized protein n=1 Tax=Pseudoloma neurophilia TaxID=146866 RepID=A0A0R0M1G9_9MICR|nr:hypothetical protein M153_100070730 [Pseudoloma neurophilia]
MNRLLLIGQIIFISCYNEKNISESIKSFIEQNGNKQVENFKQVENLKVGENLKQADNLNQSDNLKQEDNSKQEITLNQAENLKQADNLNQEDLNQAENLNQKDNLKQEITLNQAENLKQADNLNQEDLNQAENLNQEDNSKQEITLNQAENLKQEDNSKQEVNFKQGKNLKNITMGTHKNSVIESQTDQSSERTGTFDNSTDMKKMLKYADLKRRLFYDSIIDLNSLIFLIGVNQLYQDEIKEIVEEIVLPVRQIFTRTVNQGSSNIDQEKDSNPKDKNKEKELVHMKTRKKQATKILPKQSDGDLVQNIFDLLKRMSNFSLHIEESKSARFKIEPENKSDTQGRDAQGINLDDEEKKLIQAIEKRNKLFDSDHSQTVKELYTKSLEQLIVDLKEFINNNDDIQDITPLETLLDDTDQSIIINSQIKNKSLLLDYPDDSFDSFFKNKNVIKPENPNKSRNKINKSEQSAITSLRLIDPEKQDNFYQEMVDTLNRAIIESDYIEKIKRREIREFLINLLPVSNSKETKKVVKQFQILFNLGSVFITPSIFITISKGLYISDKSIFIEKMIQKILQPVLQLATDNSNGTDTEKKENILIFLKDILFNQISKYKNIIDDAYKSRSEIFEKYFFDQPEEEKDKKIKKIDIELEKRNYELFKQISLTKSEHFNNFIILNREIVNTYIRFITNNNENDKKRLYEYFSSLEV